MKAVLVIDMPDDVSLDEWYAVTVVVDRLIATKEELMQCIPFDESKVFKFVPLRPLPETKEIGYPNEDYDVGFGDGWDACLKEITDHIGENTEEVCNDDLYESWMFFDEGETE